MNVLIVGGGPAGSITAINLGEKANVTLVEAKGSSGFPVKCGGLISRECLNAYGKYAKISKAIVNAVEGAFFFSPSGKSIELFGREKAVVIERKIFDRILMEKASYYADVMMKTKFILAEGKKARLVNTSGYFNFEFDFLIGADGSESNVARSLGFERPDFYSSKQLLMEYEMLDENMVELYFGKKYSDGFFAYAIPVGDGFARVGVVSKSHPDFYLRNLLEKHPEVSKRRKRGVLEINMGPIPANLVDFVRGNTALIGDSAGMVKPYTGGGLFYLLRASEILADSFPNLEKFRKDYMDEMEKEYRTGEKIRKLYDILDDDDYDFLLKTGESMDFTSIHMDRPSTVIKLIPEALKLLKRPSLVKKIFKAFF